MDLSKASFLLIGSDGKPVTMSLSDLKTALDALDTPVVVVPPVPDDPKPVPTPFKLETPDYNSVTGDLSLKTSGGDGTPTQFYILGVSDWTPKTVLNVGELRRENRETLTIQARQSGVLATPIQFKLSGAPVVVDTTPKPGTGTGGGGVPDKPVPVTPIIEHFIASNPTS